MLSNPDPNSAAPGLSDFGRSSLAVPSPLKPLVSLKPPKLDDVSGWAAGAVPSVAVLVVGVLASSSIMSTDTAEASILEGFPNEKPAVFVVFCPKALGWLAPNALPEPKTDLGAPSLLLAKEENGDSFFASEPKAAKGDVAGLLPEGAANGDDVGFEVLLDANGDVL